MSQTVASGFIDLATFDLLEQRLYSPYGVNYYMKCVRRAKWSTHIPAPLKKMNDAKFGGEFAGRFVRSADIVLRQWLRFEISAVAFKDDVEALMLADTSNTVDIGWPKNFGHNLVEKARLTFNDVQAQEIDSYDLDIQKQFKVTASQRDNYNVMVGNVAAIQLTPASKKRSIQKLVLNVPFPWFFARDSGFGLPMCSLPFNNVDVTFTLREAEKLLAISGTYSVDQAVHVPTFDDLKTVKIDKCEVWTEYALLEEQERLRMANTPREMIIEQFQTSKKSIPTSSSTAQQDIRFSHAVKSIQFMVKNNNKIGDGNKVIRWSQYTQNSVAAPTTFVNPIKKASLLYEGTARLHELNADFFTDVEPYYKAIARDVEQGYHLWSYELHFGALNPCGSTNFSALNNPSLKIELDTNNIEVANLELIIKAYSATVVVFLRGGFGFVTY
jgi:hypothetical protein